MRQAAAAGELQRVIAARYGVSQPTIARILGGKARYQPRPSPREPRRTVVCLKCDGRFPTPLDTLGRAIYRLCPACRAANQEYAGALVDI